MSDTAIAFRCNDYVLVAAAGLNAFYYIKITDEEDKIVQLDSHQVVACIGENGPRVNFTEYIKCNIALNRVRQHGRHSSCSATANYMRNELASSIRSREGAYQVNCLFAGYDVPVSELDDSSSGPKLFYMDYLGTLQSVPYACHGYGGPFVTAILDRYWRADLTQQEGLELMQKCCDEVKRRVVVSNAFFFVKAVTANGVEAVPNVH
ncbi:20S proteasome subunit beta 4 [Angomonas deanei]|uniref:Proteasome subunit beta n=1 Tax=Angomonas deanei TaxID=59799 RepID=S9VLR6_9TRYP|nr:20S proteasome subunit beta 4 [Angomonas deanei]EPY43647.1 20S proteasome subunit beta 4 [Angomonas deanei]CAD2214109.1 Proteasome subunit, putative [Angomonas deanei]|eukprot:EPY39955.1 20S proteasome subunit beta 4 [Angomonas deanei]